MLRERTWLCLWMDRREGIGEGMREEEAEAEEAEAEDAEAEELTTAAAGAAVQETELQRSWGGTQQAEDVSVDLRSAGGGVCGGSGRGSSSGHVRRKGGLVAVSTSASESKCDFSGSQSSQPRHIPFPELPRELPVVGWGGIFRVLDMRALPRYSAYAAALFAYPALHTDGCDESDSTGGCCKREQVCDERETARWMRTYLPPLGKLAAQRLRRPHWENGPADPSALSYHLLKRAAAGHGATQMLSIRRRPPNPLGRYCPARLPSFLRSLAGLALPRPRGLCAGNSITCTISSPGVQKPSPYWSSRASKSSSPSTGKGENERRRRSDHP